MRTELIETTMREHFSEIGVATKCAERDDFNVLPPRPEKRLGIYGPLPYPAPGTEARDDDPPYMMVWSTDYIAALTDDMTEEGITEYLDIVTYIGSMMIALGRKIPDPSERFSKVEDRIMAEWPGSADLMNIVELRSLDQDLGAPDLDGPTSLEGFDGE